MQSNCEIGLQRTMLQSVVEHHGLQCRAVLGHAGQAVEAVGTYSHVSGRQCVLHPPRFITHFAPAVGVGHPDKTVCRAAISPTQNANRLRTEKVLQALGNVEDMWGFARAPELGVADDHGGEGAFWLENTPQSYKAWRNLNTKDQIKETGSHHGPIQAEPWSQRRREAPLGAAP